MEMIVKYKRLLESYRNTVLTCFCFLLSDGFFQIMYIASLNFKLNGMEVESIISKQFSVLSDL